MRLDPYTLRQAAARWPRETLNTRAAQSFLRSLAEEADRDRKPATASDPDLTVAEALTRVQALAEKLNSEAETAVTESRAAWQRNAADRIRAAVAGGQP